jgi:hypothetical protein
VSNKTASTFDHCECTSEFVWLSDLIKRAKTRDAVHTACNEFYERKASLPDAEQRYLANLLVSKGNEHKDMEWVIQFLSAKFGIRIRT